MSSLLLVGNPAKRRKSRKPRTAAQRAATAKMLAANRARKNPAKRRKARTASAAKPVIRYRTRARKNPARRRARRNPISGGLNMRSIVAQLKNAGIGAAGAIGVDVGFGFVQSYLPEAVQAPVDAAGNMNPAYYAAKGATAIVAGLLAKRLIGSARAAQMVEGSLTVTMHDAAKQFLAGNVPSLTLGAYAPGGRQLPSLPSGLGRVGMQISRRPAVANGSLRGVGSYISASSREMMPR